MNVKCAGPAAVGNKNQHQVEAQTTNETSLST